MNDEEQLTGTTFNQSLNNHNHNNTTQLQNNDNNHINNNNEDDYLHISEISNIQIKDSDVDELNDTVFEDTDTCGKLKKRLEQTFKSNSISDNIIEDEKIKRLKNNSLSFDDDNSRTVIENFLSHEIKILNSSKTDLRKEQIKIRPKSLQLTNCIDNQMNEGKIKTAQQQQQQQSQQQQPQQQQTQQQSQQLTQRKLTRQQSQPSPSKPQTGRFSQKVQLQHQDQVEEHDEQDINAILEEGFRLLSCQEKICDLYLRLHEPGSEELLTIFGSIILNFIDDIKNVMIEKNHLEQLYERTKEEHSIQIKRMEDDIDSHMKTLENKVRVEEQKKFKLQEKDWKVKHAEDVTNLRQEIRKLKESTVFTQATKESTEKLELELRASKLKNEELTKTIEELTLDLTSTKSELSNVKKKLEEKETEIARQKKISHEDSIEIDNLINQIDLLQSANKTLHEKTDDLCEALRICRSYYRTQMKQKSIIAKDDFIQKYLNESCFNLAKRENQASEIKSIKTNSSGFCDNEPDEDLDIDDLDNLNSASEYNSNVFNEKKTYESCAVLNPNQEPDRVFKIVLAGDAAVGKSSFIMRLCKNKFVTNLNSTVGVDFQTKTLKVDDKIIALQLWDTAGQERFRSIAKSYFRRADGVLLLYDVTYERSFLNVRDWIEIIKDGAQKSIPVMIVGNKCDLREDRKIKDVCLKYEDGRNLANNVECLFVEASAKSGSNINEAIIELTRNLMTNEDLEVQTVGLKLKDKDNEVKKKFCCDS